MVLIWLLCSFFTAPAIAGSTGLDVLERAKKSCSDIENGLLSTMDAAISDVDLNGDGRPDEVVNACKFRCSTASDLFQWEGGCLVSAIVDGKVSEFIAKDWKVIRWQSRPLLLLSVHGSECGAKNQKTCVRSLIWNEGKFHSPIRKPR